MFTNGHHLHVADDSAAKFLQQTCNGCHVPILKTNPRNGGARLLGPNNRNAILHSGAHRFLHQHRDIRRQNVIEYRFVRVVRRRNQHGIN